MATRHVSRGVATSEGVVYVTLAPDNEFLDEAPRAKWAQAMGVPPMRQYIWFSVYERQQ